MGARAQNASDQNASGQNSSRQSPIIDEVKLGLMAPDIGFLGDHIENGTDVEGEVLFRSPDILSIIGAPRPDLGGWINTNGNTDAVYFGLTWGLPIVQSLFGQSDGLTLYGSLGGALNDGYANGQAPPGRKLLGSWALFRESGEIGYQITPVYEISLMLEHMSDANLTRHNAGITNAGVRVGFKF